MTNFVQMFKSTDLNAPVLTGQVGSLITLLNKCLVDGYTAASVTSLVESGTNYTATLAVADTTLRVGQYILFAGASPGGANIAMRINAVTDSTHVVCTGPGGLGTITGTITYAKAPLGWTKPWAAGTNAQTYLSAATTGAAGEAYTPYTLQVIDNGATAGGAKEAQIYGAEVMSADQAVTSGRFPTAAQLTNGLCARKSATADSTARAWTLIGDNRTFYFIPITGDAAQAGYPPIGFGYFISFKAGDAFNTFIAGCNTFNSITSVDLGLVYAICIGGSIANAGLYAPRLYSQVGTSVMMRMNGYSSTSAVAIVGASVGAGALLTYPNPTDSGLYVQPLFLADTVGALRGRLPGYFAPMHVTPFTQYDIATGVAGLTGATLTALTVTTNSAGVTGQVLVDTFGPWA